MFTLKVCEYIRLFVSSEFIKKKVIRNTMYITMQFGFN
jgi:hypothetical protein